MGFAHRRLSILDLSERGHQPFHSADGRFTIVYNGEIYNFTEFRKELINKGYNLYSSTDTEVLLYLIIEYGPNVLHRLNGMFAFAVWDKLEQKLILCRDRMGVKPLYYTIFENSLYFASEPKALFAAGVPLEIDEKKWDEHLIYRYVAGESTIFKGVNRLLPGHFVTCKDGKISFTRWWNLSERVRQHETIKNPLEWFDNTFQDSVRYRMVSDVPVGVLLSGGLDSSSVLASLYRQNFKVSCFNIGFDDKIHDESALARSFSEILGYPFFSTRLEDENLLKTLEDSSWYHDEPLIHNNDPHLLAISRLAKKHVSVLLSGEGSDELMAGYVRYRVWRYKPFFSLLKVTLPLYNGLKKNLRSIKLQRYLRIRNNRDKLLLNASNLFPEDFYELGIKNLEPSIEYRSTILKEAEDLYPGQPLRQLLYLDQHTYLCSLLDRNDRSTMGAGIECREPFLDYRLVEGLATLPVSWFDKGKKGKFILLQSMKKFLPPEIVNHRKIGLSVPWTTYLLKNKVFSERMSEMKNSEVFKYGIFKSFNVEKLIANFYQNPELFGTIINQFFIIYIWYETYFKRIKEFQY
ncbi:MAG: asparagine synthase (glutamine-hydrolyzing) [Thermaurantimonas sp.]|uniref:asparagine synthase (glutamine-hydrolyzing) n=1 Tax=Thermaurantimonas sp. TaxID=2681568 RepID=UPI00391ADDA2